MAYDLNSVLAELEDLAEESYRAFSLRIIPTEQTMLGVRIPALRKIAKRIAKNDPLVFITLDKGNSYEAIMLEGMVLSYMNKSFAALLPWTEAFLSKVDNWAQIDSTVASFKNIKQDKETVLSIVTKWLQSEEEFVVRAGLLVLLGNFVDSDHLTRVFRFSEAVQHTGYYTQIANAWLIAHCMARFPEETMAFFQNNTLDRTTHNAAIQKARESRSVSKDNKALLKALKR